MKMSQESLNHALNCLRESEIPLQVMDLAEREYGYITPERAKIICAQDKVQQAVDILESLQVKVKHG